MDERKIIEMMISAFVDKSEKKTDELIEFFNTYCGSGFTVQELLDEEQKVKRVVQICRKIILDLKDYLKKQDVEELTTKRQQFLQKSMTELQDLMLYKILIPTSLFSICLEHIFTEKKEDYVNIARAQRIPAAANNENGDDPKYQKKRRHETTHTIKDQLKKRWNISIGDDRAEEYATLCDLMESIIYRFEPIKSEPISDNGQIKSKIRWFSLFNKHNIPLDLFDLPINGDVFGFLYRQLIGEFIQELERAAGADSCQYILLKIFWKDWHQKFVDDLYMVAWSDLSSEDVQNFYHTIYEPEFKNLTKKDFKGNLFAEILFNLLKEEFKNDLRGFKYIKEHSQVIINPLTPEQRLLFKFLNDTTSEKQYTYDNIKKILDKHKIEVQKILGEHVDIKKVFVQTKKIMENIVLPNKEQVFFYHFFSLMQCCAESVKSELKIEHYGMPRGNKFVKLETIIRRPRDNNCKEVKLFLIHMMRRRCFMNLFDEEIVNQIEEYRLCWEKNITDSISYIGNWQEVEEALNELADIYWKIYE